MNTYRRTLRPQANQPVDGPDYDIPSGRDLERFNRAADRWLSKNEIGYHGNGFRGAIARNAKSGIAKRKAAQ
jgi:hypothetical protein